MSSGTDPSRVLVLNILLLNTVVIIARFYLSRYFRRADRTTGRTCFLSRWAVFVVFHWKTACEDLDLFRSRLFCV